MSDLKKVKAYPLIVGGLFGFMVFFMEMMGNPGNMGLCVTSFLADTMGALGMISEPTRQYVRPEISSIIYGAFICSIIMKQFRARGGSSPVIRFCLGALVIIGSMVFMGDPLRMIIRMASGDCNAYVGFFGFVAGTTIGCMFMIKGFDLGRAHEIKAKEGVVFPLIFLVFLIINVRIPNAFHHSTSGIGSIHASKYVSSVCGYIMGIALVRAKFDITSSIVDVLIAKNWNKFFGMLTFFGIVLICKVATGQFHFGFENQPYAHSSLIWNFIGMLIVGWGCCFLGGTPLRMLVLASEGDSDAGITVFGMMFGVSATYGLGFYGSKTAYGPGPNGKLICMIADICLIVIGLVCTIKIDKDKLKKLFKKKEKKLKKNIQADTTPVEES